MVSLDLSPQLGSFRGELEIVSGQTESSLESDQYFCCGNGRILNLKIVGSLASYHLPSSKVRIPVLGRQIPFATWLYPYKLLQCVLYLGGLEHRPELLPVWGSTSNDRIIRLATLTSSFTVWPCKCYPILLFIMQSH